MKSFMSALGVTALGTLMLVSVELMAQDNLAVPAASPGEQAVVIEQPEDDSKWPTISANVNYASAYMYNGFLWNSGNVLQADISLEWQGFYAGAWTNWDFMDDNGYQNNDFEEWDYFAGYDHTFDDVAGLGAITLGAVFTYFDYPSFPEWDCPEIGLSVCLDDVLLSPNATINWDYEDDRYWASLGGSHSIVVSPISEKLSVDMEGNLYWANSRYNYWNYGVATNALTAFQFKAGLSYAVCDHFSFGPFMLCAWALDHELRDVWKDDIQNNAFNVLWGFALSAEY